ncbi:MAG: glycosyltransferase [Candidatus Lokiarchaeota archaeon]|nr:glycosyltransferase [Candidatus Lokiarchaeota archaeon]
MKMENYRNLSIIVPTYNRYQHLRFLLNSIDKQSTYPREVIIINDCSIDQTESFLNKWRINKEEFNVIVYNSPENKGPAVARNIGIQLASCDLIAFTDDDCILSKDWVKQIQNSKLWKDEGIAGIGGKVIPYQKNLVSEYYTFHRILEPPKFIQYLVTANACYRRDLLLEIDGFDEDHCYPGGEDNGLSFKLIRIGYRFGFEKNMIVYHNYRTSIPAFLKTFYRYGKGCAETTIKYLKNNQLGFQFKKNTDKMEGVIIK